MAIMAKVFTENIESMRSYIESMIGDEEFHFGRRKTIPELVEIRPVFGEKALGFDAPENPKSRE